MKQYYWKIESDGYIKADNLDEAKEYLELHGIGLIMDDEKYWKVDIEEEDHPLEEVKK